METYEEKYKDLVKRLNKAREEKGVYTFNSVLDAVAPELKESEDERIRTKLLNLLKELLELGGVAQDTWSMNDCEQFIAWLEKQGEQKRQMPLVKSVSTDFKNRLGTLMHYTSVDLEKEENKQLLNEAAKELLQLAYSDKANEIALASAKTFEESMAILIAANNAYKRGQKEQKSSAWSEEDDNDAWLNDIISKAECNLQLNKGEIDFLKSLKDRVEPRREWTEEDENHVKSILSTIECCKAQFPNAQAVVEAYNADIEWLKSLRPKSQWKPSEEQMDALEHSLGDYNIKIFEDRYEILKSLYEQLKKLREE